MDWDVFLLDPGGKHATYFAWMISAWGWTIAVALSALAVAVVVGLIVGVLRTLPGARVWAWLGDSWVELFRNVPLLVQLFLWFYVMPAIVTPMKHLPSFVLVVIAIGLFTSARIAEQVKSGILALPRGQYQAATALGMSTAQTYHFVLLPVALRIILPPLTSEAMNVFKNSAVAFAVSVPELTMFALQAQEETSRGVTIYAAVTVLYMISALAVNRLMVWIEHVTQLPGQRHASQ